MLQFTLGGVAIALYVFTNFDLTGLLGGLVGTLFGTGGPFYMIYLMIRRLENDALRASFAANFRVDGSLQRVLWSYSSTGHITCRGSANIYRMIQSCQSCT